MRNSRRLLALLLILTAGVPSWATCTLVQNVVKGTCGAASTCTITNANGLANTGTGHILFIGMASQTASQTLTGASDSGSSYVHCDGTHTNCVGSDANGASTDVYMTFSSVATLATTGITATRNSSTAGWTMELQEWNCPAQLADNAGNIDQTTATTSIPGVGLTLSGSNDIIYQILSLTAAQTISVSAPYTLVDNNTSRGFAYSANTASGTAPTWTLGGNARASGSAVAVKDAPAGTGRNSTIPVLGVGQ